MVGRVAVVGFDCVVVVVVVAVAVVVVVDNMATQ